MSETLANGHVTLYCGDCIEVLATLPAASIDSVVTDPPYHLQSIHKRFAKVGRDDKTWTSSGPHQRTVAGFMNKKWDGGDVAFRSETWVAVLRVMKPGAHLVAFGGTRTYHRMACAIEDAGFEIRDTIAWLYGSGFPKSHDVSKAIDRRRVEDIKPVRAICRVLRAAMNHRGLKSRDLVAYFGDCHARLIDHWAARDTDSQPSLPTWEQWLTLKKLLGLDTTYDQEVWRLNGRNGKPGEAWDQREVMGDKPYSSPAKHMSASTFSDVYDPTRVRLKETAPATAAARAWAGFGTALKPAFEPIILARKPLAPGMTVAGNVLAYGTGGINIDGCRVGTDPISQHGRSGGFTSAEKAGRSWNGRWPANLVHDGSDEVLKAFPDQVSGGTPLSRPRDKTRHTYGSFNGVENPDGIGPTAGSSARFFYTAKADADDRLGSKHPTIKPIDLMQWLVRLVTPPGGVVLDCFAGTGTTGEAAFREGFSAVLIEREPEYQADIRRRMSLLLSGKDSRRHEAVKASGKAQDAGPLFAHASTEAQQEAAE